MSSYYNEIDPFAAEWLRQLIKAGHIADGVVDERSIVDVVPNELREFTQCHFFAGIGVWSYALRRAGWGDETPVWTGSCPCQPFSAAGSGSGFDDERHLWPAFFHLIQELQPSVVIGEQVASKAVEPWIDLVQSDVESLGYAFGAIPFPSAGVGAPHIRDRLYWVAEGLDNPSSSRHLRPFKKTESNSRDQTRLRVSSERGGLDGVADSDSGGRRTGGGLRLHKPGQEGALAEFGGEDDGGSAGPTNGLWRHADWLGCTDGRWRPVEPGTFPLAHGSPARVGRLRGYGNAINAESAAAFVAAYLETKEV